MECCLQSAWMQEIQRQIALRHSPLPTNHALAWLTPSYYHSSILYPSSSHSSFTNYNFSPLPLLTSSFFLSKTAWLYSFTVDLSLCCTCSHIASFDHVDGFHLVVYCCFSLWTWTQKVHSLVFWPTLPSASHSSKNIPKPLLFSLPTQCHFLSPSSVVCVGIFFCQCFSFSLNHFHWEPYSSSTPF